MGIQSSYPWGCRRAVVPSRPSSWMVLWRFMRVLFNFLATLGIVFFLAIVFFDALLVLRRLRGAA